MTQSNITGAINTAHAGVDAASARAPIARLSAACSWLRPRSATQQRYCLIVDSRRSDADAGRAGFSRLLDGGTFAKGCSYRG